ncbi:unnamed protein product, partial [Meganyctiphanes norvegica]
MAAEADVVFGTKIIMSECQCGCQRLPIIRYSLRQNLLEISLTTSPFCSSLHMGYIRIRAVLLLFITWSSLSEGQELRVEVLKRPIICTQLSSVGDTIKVDYTGRFPNGTIFDSSLPRGSPFEFRLGAGQVIKGWDRGLQNMCVGERRRLTVPPSLAYGNEGAGGIIPPGAILVFDVELISLPQKQVSKEPENHRVARPPQKPRQQVIPVELVAQTLVRPQLCTRTATIGDRITVHYAGYLTNSKKFDSSMHRHYRQQCRYGNSTIIKERELLLFSFCISCTK